MKKNIICILSLLLVGTGVCLAFISRDNSFYESVSQTVETDDGTFLTPEAKAARQFYAKMTTCSPAKLSETKETVSGKNNNGTCKYSVTLFGEKGYETHYCSLPMSVALGYATTMLCYIDNSSEEEKGRRDICFNQNQEILKIMSDYCTVKYAN